MNYQEALNVLGLTGEITEESVKKTFKKLAMKYHPDRNPAGAEMMKMINAATDFILANIEKFQGFNHSENAYDYGDLVAEVLNKILSLDGLIVEVVGNWLWISGNTRQYKDRLKALGCQWAPKKMKWYWMPEEERHARHYRGKSTMAEIRNKYGSTRFVKGDDNKKAITA